MEGVSIERNRVVGRDCAGIGESADLVQVVGRGKRTPGGGGIGGWNLKRGVVAEEIGGEGSLGSGQGSDSIEGEFLDQAILERAKEAFDPALGLGRPGADGGNVQFDQGATYLGGCPLTGELFRQ